MNFREVYLKHGNYKKLLQRRRNAVQMWMQ